MMLVFDHVCVFYGDTPVLRELSFQVCSGEQVGLIGANGAGKSTLMKAALGLLPYTGSITVDGTPVTRKILPEVRRKLGCVLQDADNQMFMPTVLDDMVFGPMNYGLSRAAVNSGRRKRSRRCTWNISATGTTIKCPAAKSGWPPSRPSSPCSRRCC